MIVAGNDPVSTFAPPPGVGRPQPKGPPIAATLPKAGVAQNPSPYPGVAPDDIPELAKKEVEAKIATKAATEKKQAATDVETLADAWKTANQYTTYVKPQIGDMTSLNKSGLIQGPWSDAKVKMAQALKSVGMLSASGEKELVNSQVWDKETANLLLSQIKEIGGARILRTEMDILRDSVPKLDTNQEARAKVLKIIADIGERRVLSAQRMQAYYDNKGGLAGYDASQTYPWDPKPKDNSLAPSNADIEHTAKKYGMTPEQVRKRLGIK